MKKNTQKILGINLVVSFLLLISIIGDFIGSDIYGNQCSGDYNLCHFLVFTLDSITILISILFSLYLLIFMTYTFAKRIREMYPLMIISVGLSFIGSFFSLFSINIYINWVGLICFLGIFLLSLFNMWKD